jgi:enamine deaminase RidA (YjgF/YER057c/UK114 family)
MGAEARLAELGLALPAPRPAVGTYVGHVRVGDLLFLSGQASEGIEGRVGAELSVEQGAAAARLCALELLGQVRDAVGSLDRVARIVKLLGFVACPDGFRETPAVLNGASDLLVELFGERGRHARSAIGVSALPGGLAVEVEMVVEVARAGGR